jgi:hypothetical protein
MAETYQNGARIAIEFAAMDPLDQPLSTLIGHHIEIATRCACTKVTVFSPEYLVERMGAGVTLRIAGSRLKCRACGQRPALSLSRDYATSEGRDNRRDPPALPEWVVGLLVR